MAARSRAVTVAHRANRSSEHAALTDGLISVCEYFDESASHRESLQSMAPLPCSRHIGAWHLTYYVIRTAGTALDSRYRSASTGTVPALSGARGRCSCRRSTGTPRPTFRPSSRCLGRSGASLTPPARTRGGLRGPPRSPVDGPVRRQVRAVVEVHRLALDALFGDIDEDDFAPDSRSR